MIMHVSGLVVVDKKTTMYVYARMCFFCVCVVVVLVVCLCAGVWIYCVCTIEFSRLPDFHPGRLIDIQD